MTNFRALKISRRHERFGCTLFAEFLWLEHAGTTTNLQIVFNTQNNPYLNQAIQKIPA